MSGVRAGQNTALRGVETAKCPSAFEYPKGRNSRLQAFLWLLEFRISNTPRRFGGSKRRARQRLAVSVQSAEMYLTISVKMVEVFDHLGPTGAGPSRPTGVKIRAGGISRAENGTGRARRRGSKTARVKNGAGQKRRGSKTARVKDGAGQKRVSPGRTGADPKGASNRCESRSVNRREKRAKSQPAPSAVGPVAPLLVKRRVQHVKLVVKLVERKAAAGAERGRARGRRFTLRNVLRGNGTFYVETARFTLKRHAM